MIGFHKSNQHKSHRKGGGGGMENISDKDVEDTREPYLKALEDDQDGLREYYKKKPEKLFCPVTAAGDTVFHIAAYRGHRQLLEVLLRMVPYHELFQVLTVQNVYGNTILHEAATAATVETIEFLLQYPLRASSSQPEEGQIIREQMLEEQNKFGETPLFKAAAYGRTLTVDYLVKRAREVGQDVHSHFTRKDGLSILHIAVLGQHFETAIWLLKNVDGDLATYKDKGGTGKTCLQLLANMPKAFYSTSELHPIQKFVYKCCHPSGFRDEDVALSGSVIPVLDLEIGKPTGSVPHHLEHTKEWMPSCIKEIYEQKKTHEEAVELAKMLVTRDTSWLVPYDPEEDNTICLSRDNTPEDVPIIREGFGEISAVETPLMVAARSGITEIFDKILKLFPQAIEHVNKEGQNVLHVAIKHRQYEIFERVKELDDVTKRRLARDIDKNGRTILHHAAEMEYYHARTRKATPAVKLQQERAWFQEVKSIMPSHYTMHRNKGNQSAKDLFTITHKDQHSEAKKWVKGTSQSCSAVAVLVATVVYAAAFTVPGGTISDKGVPVLLEKPMYTVFTVMDIAALATSLSSLVMFLSILTSSLEIRDFHWLIPWQLWLGFSFLFFSVITTVLSFTATIILIFKIQRLSAKTLTYVAAFSPIAFYALVQSPLYFQLLENAIRVTLNLAIKILPNSLTKQKKKEKNRMK